MGGRNISSCFDGQDVCRRFWVAGAARVVKKVVELGVVRVSLREYSAVRGSSDPAQERPKVSNHGVFGHAHVVPGPHGVACRYSAVIGSAVQTSTRPSVIPAATRRPSGENAIVPDTCVPE